MVFKEINLHPNSSIKFLASSLVLKILKKDNGDPSKLKFTLYII